MFARELCCDGTVFMNASSDDIHKYLSRIAACHELFWTPNMNSNVAMANGQVLFGDMFCPGVYNRDLIWEYHQKEKMPRGSRLLRGCGPLPKQQGPVGWASIPMCSAPWHRGGTPIAHGGQPPRDR